MRYGNMELTVEEVSPVIAKRWLELNSSNRRIRPKVVRMYAGDMTNKEWQLKPLAICFDEENKLGNGQHTLLSIIQSGTTQSLLIARGCSREQIAAMDVGLRRSINDVAHFLDVPINTRQAAIARVLKFGVADENSRSFNELFDAYLEYSDSIDFVCGVCRTKDVGMNSSVMSAVAMAYGHCPTSDLTRFLTVLSTGITEEPRDKTVIRLRDFCRSQKGGLTRAARVETHQKAMSALDAYLNNRVLSKIYGTKTKPFTKPFINAAPPPS